MSDDKLNPKHKAFKEIKWIPVKNLSVVWAEAQRPLNDRHARNIADNFDPEMFGTISVTRPNGKGVYHIIDGHHRKVAIEKLWGLDEMAPCQVYDAEDPARAAQLFDRINSNRLRPQPVDLFKTRVTAGEEVQVEVNRVVLKCGFFVGQNAANSLTCVQALESVHQSYGPIILEYSLKLLHQIWGNDKSANTANIVRGFGMFLSEFRHIELDKLANLIAAKYTPARFIGAARAGKEVNGGSTPAAIRDLMIATYNSTVRADRNKLRTAKKGKNG